jgi:hypothetical protein
MKNEKEREKGGKIAEIWQRKKKDGCEKVK